jgi:hypothetical protein
MPPLMVNSTGVKSFGGSWARAMVGREAARVAARA